MEPEQVMVGILWRLTKDGDRTEGEAPVSSVKRRSTKKEWNEKQV
jgi:hypothetical protein